MKNAPDSPNRRRFLQTGALVAAGAAIASPSRAVAAPTKAIVTPPAGKPILLSCKLGMIAKKRGEEKLTLTQRLSLAGEAGLDGVDFDQAGAHTAEEARAAVQESGVFVHNAINHAHWGKRLTSAKAEERAEGVANIEHCIRVSHAAGGN